MTLPSPYIKTNDPLKLTNVANNLVNPPLNFLSSADAYMSPKSFSTKALSDGSGVALSWANPVNYDWDTTVIVKRRFGFVNSPIDTRGQIIYQGEGISFLDTAIAPGEIYYYVAFGLGDIASYWLSIGGVPALTAYLAGLGIDKFNTLNGWFATGRTLAKSNFGWNLDSQASALAITDYDYASLMYGDR